MRYSKYFIPTYKEIPAEAEVVSHQLMLRAGMIRKLAAGIYSYLPAGLRSIKKVEGIIREEMNKSGAIEILMPAVQPAELWQESGRWDFYGKELLRFKDRHNRDLCLGPTHEEVITDLVRREIQSYKQMPVNFYQIQTKFRDEIRPRFGVMRCREFIMKDAYSFDVDERGADKSYEIMYETYSNIFRRCGLKFKAVEADTGSIGGSFSHEFMVLARTGEDEIVSCRECDYAANLEKAEVRRGAMQDPPSGGGALRAVEEVSTPGIRTVEEVTEFLSIRPEQLVKTLIFKLDGELVAALVRGDHELNETKLRNVLGTEQVELADPELVEEVTGAPMGFAGPIGLKVKIVADQALMNMKDFVTGGNKEDLHLRNVNVGRDFQVDLFGDIRVITPQDRCPRCSRELSFARGIEVGHIFKLGTKYSKAMGALFLDEKGKETPIVMGCYGIGVGRTVAAAIEQNHDDNGIIFPIPIAPFEVVILPLQMQEGEVVEIAERIYRELEDRGVDVLLDDRDVRPGVKFKDADLLGTPLRVTVGMRNLRNGKVEVKARSETESTTVSLDRAAEILKGKMKELYDSTQ
ncbi:MAG: proline--tRNA ligase [Deltaproteobacteria bacterium]|nr:proline--tRNA ligase [Deltaproteobacteria bacterium]MBW2136453.1 proline--tRNA ligase [Deltaproteobacteria bacterium]